MDQPTVVFFPEGAYGPTNNCIGIGRALQELGVRVVFVVEESFAGTLEAKGFEERLMRLTPPPEQPEEPGQFWKDFIANTAPHFRESTFEQIHTLIAPIWESLIGGALYVEPRLREIFAELRPDVIVEDNEALDDDYVLTAQFVEKVVDAADDGDGLRLRSLLEDLHPADVADLMGFLTAEHRAVVVVWLPPELLAETLPELDDGIRGEVTIVVEGSSGAPAVGTDPGSLRTAVAELEESGSTRKEAIAEVAKRAGLPKREVYDVVHR